MSTMRKLRRTMGTRHNFGEPQKPQGKIADLPEDVRRLVRYLIRTWSEQKHLGKEFEITLDEAAERTERLIDSGELKIIMEKSPKTIADLEDMRYTIVPTGKF